MKNKYFVYGAIGLIGISLLFSTFSKDKYEVMSKSQAASKMFFSTSCTQLQDFCERHRVISIEMDDGDYILIKYR